MTLHKKIPFYRQLISYASAGFALLDAESQNEVRNFIVEQQDESGGFCDRAGFPDLYYTLFGSFLSSATGLFDTRPATADLNDQPDGSPRLPGSREKMLLYVGEQQRLPQISLIHDSCLAILGKETRGGFFRNIQRIAIILKRFISGAGDISRTYQYFMVFLALDAYGLNNRLTRLLARPFFNQMSAMVGMPCPVTAATLVLKSELGLPLKHELKQLMRFFDEEQGFMALERAPAADLLSTAVALAALKRGGADFRLVRPACLKLIEANYDAGAFLAGNGDQERDTEYTFYGLMALGLLK